MNTLPMVDGVRSAPRPLAFRSVASLMAALMAISAAHAQPATEAAAEAPPQAAAPQSPPAPPAQTSPSAPSAPAAPAAPPAPSATHPQPPLPPMPRGPDARPPDARAGEWRSGESRTYAPGMFDGVEIGGSADVRYVQGDADQVVVEGGAEVQRGVSIDVRDRMLRIRAESGWRFWSSRRLQVQITSQSLSRVVIQGAADFTAPGLVQVGRLAVQISGAGLARFDQLHAEQLNFGVSGAGDGQMSGQARELSVQVSGKSEFRGENLQTQRARVSISGIGDVKLWAQDELSVTVAGVGQVEYWGLPRVRQHTSGPSTITARGAKGAAP